jgi:hypothetical protein
MNRRQTYIICAASILCAACKAAPPASSRNDSAVAHTVVKPASTATLTQGSFAYVNSDGTELLALDSLAAPSSISGAVCPGTGALRVRYDRRMGGQSDDNGRQVASNFGNEQGEVFTLTEAKATPDKTCYLSSDSTLIAWARTANTREPSACSSAEVSRLADVKRRKVAHCWTIATLPPHREVLAVQFADVDTNALASLVVIGDSSIVFKDYPAVRRADDQSTWRVDDEGVFSASSFDILFVADSPYGFVMATTWSGAEGEDSELMVADSAGNFRTLSKAYRYWSPS